MARKTKQPYKCDYYASVGDNDKFAMLYDGMCRSKAYQSLSLGARYFYIMCRVQSRSQHGTACLYKHGAEYGITYNSERDFVFPSIHQKMYGYDRSNGNKYLKELEKKGFIEKKEGNQPRFKVNVYSFSTKWKNME